MTRAMLGIIGGSGLYDLPGLEKAREERIASPWGEPSAPLRIGEIAGLPVVFARADTPIDPLQVGLLGWTGWIVLAALVALTRRSH